MGTIFFDLGHTWKETFSRAAMLFFIAVSPVSHLVQELWKSSLKGIWGALETKVRGLQPQLSTVRAHLRSPSATKGLLHSPSALHQWCKHCKLLPQQADV
eukprot:scaffold79900_cov21-Tisochrysis_lutea.AAC.1